MRDFFTITRKAGVLEVCVVKEAGKGELTLLGLS